MREYKYTGLLMRFFILAGLFLTGAGLFELMSPKLRPAAPFDDMISLVQINSGLLSLAIGQLGRVVIHMAQSGEKSATHLETIAENLSRIPKA